MSPSKKRSNSLSAENGSRDAAVQQTNDDSVVSKRSAVYHGYMEDPYLRFFVKKLSRRSPLINRGYYLRMAVITDLVRRCIRHFQANSKALVQVVSLGAGYDTLAMRLKNLEENANVHFYEVDFPAVMESKAHLIHTAPPGSFPGDLVADPSQELLKLRSANYCGIGVDLREAQNLVQSLARASVSFSPTKPTILYAECVMQYMPPTAAAELIHSLADSFSHGLFLAYDQLNPTDSFGRLMQQALRAKGSPLLGLADAPNGVAMLRRAVDQGMAEASFANFHDLSEYYLSGAEGKRVDALEPFDEAEEWCEMCEHYGITMATTSCNVQLLSHPSFRTYKENARRESQPQSAVLSIQNALSESWPSGRFGFEGWGSGDAFTEVLADGDVVTVMFGGFCVTRGHRRTNVVHVHSLRDGECTVTATGVEPPALVFHSMSRIGRGVYVVFGGRTNPSEVSGETYLVRVDFPALREARQHVSVVWSKMALKGTEKPEGRYRHVAVTLPDTWISLPGIKQLWSSVFVFGGRGTDGLLLNDAWAANIVDSETIRWRRLCLKGVTPPPLAAASGVLLKNASESCVLISGGCGTPCEGNMWRVNYDTGVCTKLASTIGPRFSHTMTPVKVNGTEYILILGGAAMCPRAELENALLLDASTGEVSGSVQLPPDCPTFIRHRCVPLGDGAVAIVGGGFTCFSFGTFAARPCLLLIGDKVDKSAWQTSPVDAKSNPCATSDALSEDCTKVENTHTNAKISLSGLMHFTVSRPVLSPTPFNAETFAAAVGRPTRPVLFRGVDLGACVPMWSQPSYLKEKEGATTVSVHVARLTHLLDFVKKNFNFRHILFSDLVDHCVAGAGKGTGDGESWYLRSIATNMKSERANIWKDFPGIGQDFQLPQEAWAHIGPRMHQSCLRLNAPPLQLWTHYDTLDNVLCQVAGRKRVVLFPPSEYNNLYMSGSSSSVLNIDAPDLQRFPRFADACRHAVEVILEPGDMLFFPALWLHHITTMGEEYSISVNVFFERFDHEDYDKKDLYGNKDLPAAVRLRQAIVEQTRHLMGEKTVERMNDGKPLSQDFVEFALRQAIQDLEGMADSMAATSRAASRD